MTRRAKYVHEISERFWKQWYKLVFPSVVIRPKWHVQVRNLRVDDIVMIADNNALRGNYRLARVSEVYLDSKGRIRQVQVTYKLDTAKSYTNVKRDVRRLVLLLPIEEHSQHDEVGGVNTGM